MSWERITSKDNRLLHTVSRLASSAKARSDAGLYVCEGKKLLQEALRDGVRIEAVLWTDSGRAQDDALAALLDAQGFRKALLPETLYEKASILENSPGPLFVCAMPRSTELGRGKYIALDGVQDPGNIGTILRTAEAFGIDGVILLEGCADPFQPKAVRASMGSVFRQPIMRMDAQTLFEKAEALSLPVYAAALYEDSRSLEALSPGDAVMLIGSEGHGVSPENIRRCTGSVIIPMCGKTESLNAAAAAAVIMWEMRKWQGSTGSGSRN